MIKLPREFKVKIVRTEYWIALLLVVATLIVYWQVGSHDFIGYDDPVYVTDNAQVRQGLTGKTIAWAFTATQAANWHPLTWLSHMLDVQIYGMNPGNHHLTSVLIHLFNTLLLFNVLHRATGRIKRAAIVAALFALHPLHVESVAWIAERKDVLSSFFWLLSLNAYASYTERPGILRYLAVLSCFLLGLMTKPMVITLPVILILMDRWPLNRLGPVSDPKGPTSRTPALLLVLEKLPFVCASVLSGVITLIAQHRGDAVAPLEMYSLGVRIGNAMVSYVHYLIKTVFPLNLTMFYPHKGMPPGWQIAGALLVLVTVTTLAVKMHRQRPWFPMGWLWYLVTLLPVIGLVQVGSQAMADRYTYIPLIGIFVVAVWGGHGLFRKIRLSPPIQSTTILLMLTSLGAIAWMQTGYWKNSYSLYHRAIDVTENNYIAHFNLGVRLSGQGKFDRAIFHYRKAIEARPGFAQPYHNLGYELARMGLDRAAVSYYRKALDIDPGYAAVHHNLGNALLRIGEIDGAIIHYAHALKSEKSFDKAHASLGLALLRRGHVKSGVIHLERALRAEPTDRVVEESLKRARTFLSDIQNASDRFRQTLRFDPLSKNVERLLERVTALKYAMHDRIADYMDYLSLQPFFETNQFDISHIKAVRAAGQAYQSALEQFRIVAKKPGGHSAAGYHIACILASQGEKTNAEKWLQSILKAGGSTFLQPERDRDLDDLKESAVYRKIIGKRSKTESAPE